jgi:predicted naringenin-chalcone synthase
MERDTQEPKVVTQSRLRAKHIEWAQRLLSRAVLGACADASVEPRQISHVTVCTSTGYLLPGLTAYIIQDKGVGIPKNVSRVDIVGMGCHAGLNSLKSAASWAVANPGKYALACGVEINSAGFVWGRKTCEELNTIVVNSLFGDGCFAMVLRAPLPSVGAAEGGGNAAIPGYLNLYPQWMTALCEPAALQDMIYAHEESEGKTSFLLSELAPYHVGQALCNMMHDAICQDIPVHRAHHFIVHTGGKTVMDLSSIALALEGPPCVSMPYTHQALRDFGNQSSCSFAYAFDKLVKSQNARAGDQGAFVTMGPGAGFELAVWTAGERMGPCSLARQQSGSKH